MNHLDRIGDQKTKLNLNMYLNAIDIVYGKLDNYQAKE